MKFLIDMNLSPALCRIMEAEGWNAEHWSEVGNPAAEDDVIMDWARNSGRIIITHYS